LGERIKVRGEIKTKEDGRRKKENKSNYE